MADEAKTEVAVAVAAAQEAPATEPKQEEGNTVNLANVSDADLKKLYADEIAKDNAPTSPAEKITAPPIVEEKKAEPAKEPDKKPSEAPPVPDETSTLKAEVEKLKRQVDEKERLVRKHAQEVGEVRKLAEKYGLNKLEKVDPDKFAENPDEYTKAYLERQRAIEKLKETQLSVETDEKRLAILSKIPDIENFVEDMASVAKEIGVSDNALSSFKTTWWQEDVNTLMPLYLAAKKGKALADREAKLNHAMQELTQLKQRSTQVIRKIAANASEEATLTSGSGVSSSERSTFSPAELAQMSYEQVKAAYEDEKRRAAM